jgi:peptidyl-prolyl cis-trans isomerase B (cyclophilin B)
MTDAIRRWGLATALALAGSVASAAEDPRVPVPEPGARSAAAAQLKKEFKTEFGAKDADTRRKLARTLLDRAAADGDAATRYAGFELVQALAEELHDVRLAVDGAHGMGRVFQVPPAAKALAAVGAATRNAKDQATFADGAAACVDIAGDALSFDDATTAGSAISDARHLATSAKLGGLAARVAELSEFVASFRRMASAAVDAAKPADPAAGAGGTAAAGPSLHEVQGRLAAFGRGDWAQGLPLLGESTDPALKDAAAKDVSAGTEPAARGDVADAWWQLAQKEKDALARARMLARAAAVYEALPDGAPPERAKLAKERLATLTWFAWSRGVALTKDFSRAGPAQLGLATIRAYIAQMKIDHEGAEWRLHLPRFPETSFGSSEEYLWQLETNQGPITVRFFPETAPNHVANFLYLTELGFFDDLVFQRVIPGFMAQGGCPKKDGSSGPGYKFAGEFGGPHKHDKPGILSMANAGPATDGSQFFLTFAAAPHLDGKHTVFGEVVGGLETLKKIEAQGTADGTPKIPLIINSARIVVR